jgi:hypothetical protein
MAAGASAQRKRNVQVKRSGFELVTLRHEAAAVAEDTTHRRSQSQRRLGDLEANKFTVSAPMQAFVQQASYRRVVLALVAGSPAYLRDSAAIAAARALRPGAGRPAMRAPLKYLAPAPKIAIPALEKAVCKMGVCSAAGPDLPVPHASGLVRSTVRDAGGDTGAKAHLPFMQVCANGDLTTCVARYCGTIKHVSYKRTRQQASRSC